MGSGNFTTAPQNYKIILYPILLTLVNLLVFNTKAVDLAFLNTFSLLFVL